VCNIIHKIVLQFYVFLCLFTPHVVGSIFPYPVLGTCCAIQLQVGLLEVPTTYLGSLGYFLARGLLLLNGYPS
jgi:hypothetical protein